MRRNNRFIGGLTVAVLMLCSTSASAAMLDVQGGTLFGATGVLVEGYGRYDVQFMEGSCDDLFSPCLGSDNFTFTTLDEATQRVRR
jgi:hypothetical protein